VGLTGHATPDATAAHAARHRPALEPAAFAPLGATGLVVSRLGFGGYRVDDATTEHAAALGRALDGGVNLIDTSTNYTDGGSERLIGRVLAERARRGRLAREALVVVSKVGYVQGANLALAREREAAGRPFPEMVRYAEGIWHCIHPDFLADQLPRSLGRLGLATLDVCLLHNPEYFLSDAAHRAGPRRTPLAAVREEFDRRLVAAFRFLEGQVAAGTLRWYGVSSNTVAAAPDDPEATSLPRMLAAAREAGGEGHHFGVLQLPLNLVESAGVLEPACEPPETVLECAARAGIGVLVNRPLNAIVGRSMLRLADVPAEDGGGDPGPALARLAELEAEYRERIAGDIRVSAGSTPPEAFFRWAEQLGELVGRVHSLTHWEQIEGQVAGLVARVGRALDGGLTGAVGERWQAWRPRYLEALGRTLAAFRGRAAEGSRSAARRVAAAVDPRLPDERRGESLSRKALWVLASTPGVSTVLVGMRRERYVDDALGVLRWPPLAEVRPVYEAMRAFSPPAS